jgi:hypothetical protein
MHESDDPQTTCPPGQPHDPPGVAQTSPVMTEQSAVEQHEPSGMQLLLATH